MHAVSDVLTGLMMIESSQVAQDFLAEHNAYRTEVKRSDLVWDTELAKVGSCSVCMCVCVCVYVCMHTESKSRGVI